MINKLHYIGTFIKTALSSKGADLATAKQLYKVAKKCVVISQHTEREDLFVEDFHSFVARILGVFSMIVSYHESIVFLCLSKQALNASILLRTQLEAHLIFCYLINPNENLDEVEERVHEYQDWVCIKMYLNSKKSKDFDLFTLNPMHSLYLQQVEENYATVKTKYSDKPELFKELEKSQSFLKNKSTKNLLRNSGEYWMIIRFRVLKLKATFSWLKLTSCKKTIKAV